RATTCTRRSVSFACATLILHRSESGAPGASAVALLWASARSPRCSQICHLAASCVCGTVAHEQCADSLAAPARDAGLPRSAAQSRGRAGAARRDPGQQRSDRPRLEFSEARPFLRRAPCPDLRDSLKAHLER